MPAFYNRATLTYNGVTTRSNMTVGELETTLGISKTPVTPTYTTGDNETYIITLTNTGTAPYTDLTLTDDLGAYTFGAGTVTPLTFQDGSLYYYQNGTLQPTPTVTTAAPLEITGIEVPAGGNATIVYQTLVNEYATPTAGGTITNTVTVNNAALPVETASATITAADLPRLAIAKSLSPLTVSEGGTLTYTFVIQNYADTPVTTGDGVILNDTFSPTLSNITVTNNGTTWAPANYTYVPATGAFATNNGAITVPAATFTQDPVTGAWTTTPGTTTIAVTGTV